MTLYMSFFSLLPLIPLYTTKILMLAILLLSELPSQLILTLISLSLSRMNWSKVLMQGGIGLGEHQPRGIRSLYHLAGGCTDTLGGSKASD